MGPSTEVSEAGWSATLATNLTSAFLGAKHRIPEMIKHGGGSIIFTSTFVGYSFAFPGTAAYPASKAGLIGLTQTLAAEYGPQGVRVNAIVPGAVDTEMYRGMNDTAESQTFVTVCTRPSASRSRKSLRARRSTSLPTIRPL